MKNERYEFKKEFKKRLYTFTLTLISSLEVIEKDSISDAMIRQLVRSGTSILANYIEAQASSSRKDFTNFFHYALKSANESKVWIALLRDTKRISHQEANNLLQELEEIGKILGSSIVTLKKK